MPKPAKDLRLHGVKFEDAVKKILSVPAPSKPAKTKPKKTPQNPALN
jgi:hypothetical protein